MIEIKSEIVSRQTIKPSTPTPPHLKTFKLSLLDQISPDIHGNMTFFYPSDSTTHPISNDHYFFEKSKLLQDSISKTLSLFYPLGGRLLDAATVDCNDEGAIFVEAKVNIPLSHFLNQPDFILMDHFLPTTDPTTMELSNGAMFLVRFTSFTCGGVAISLSLTHKVADVSALLTLLQCWSSVCRGLSDPITPDLIGEKFLAPRDELSAMSVSVNVAVEKFEQRRFVFSASKIAELKAKVDKEFQKALQSHPSRVEVVLALLWKCAVATKKKKTGSFGPTVLFQAINLRKRLSPLPETAVGNFIWPFMVVAYEEKDLELHELVIQMRKSLNEFNNTKANMFTGEGAPLAIMGAIKERGEFFRNNKEMTVYKCSSWCKFPLYDTDFGWGKVLNSIHARKSGSIGKWFQHHKELGTNTVKKKDKIRAENARVHSAVSVAGLAAGLAALAAAGKPNGTTTGSKMSTALASATQLLASHCIELAELAGADNDRVGSVVKSAVDIQTAGDLMTLTAAAATALRGEAAVRARLPKEAKKNAAISPYERTMTEAYWSPDFLTQTKEPNPPCEGELLQHTRKGVLRWKRVNVYINKKSQVMIKLKSKHVGGAFSKNNKCIVYGVCDETSAWPYRKERETCEELYFGLKTGQGLLEFKCKSKIHKQKWVDGIQNLLRQVSYTQAAELSLEPLSIDNTI